MDNSAKTKKGSRPEWIEIVSKYNTPDLLKSWWQIVNSVGPYAILWVLMIKSLEVSYWLTLLLSVLAAGFLVRIFIIFHDCGHGSFFKSKRMNTIVGVATGLLVFTPYKKWTHEHLIHHQTVGNLDKRGIGDVSTLTVSEYLKLSKLQRISYRIYRNPFILFGIAPLLVFVVFQRFTNKSMKAADKFYVHLSTLGMAAWVAGLMLIIGWKTFLLIQIPVLYIGAAHGLWLFYVQHQFRHVVWTKNEDWDYKTIATEGSSLFKLPAILNWFTGNIGYHHVHHLGPTIPNYNLKKCHNENPFFKSIKPITFLTAFESLRLRLWDEKRQMLISFSEIV
jgi:acyl-lipid omega-6 desaturase (Delta-12 desaturase)